MKSLVLGSNGQDGSYLCEALLRRGDEVIGISRAEKFESNFKSSFEYIQFDLEDAEGLSRLLEGLKPDRCFHFAAVHGAAGSGFEYESRFPAMINVNLVSLQVLLEHARKFNSSMQVIYAGSGKIFQTPLIGSINEASPVAPSCLYSIGKIAARDLIQFYRVEHSILATCVVLFNHDSPRRQLPFLLAQVAKTIAQAKIDRSISLKVRSLDFWVDWGSASEYMEIVADIPISCQFSNLIVATGNSHYARDVICNAFERHGLDAKLHVEEDIFSMTNKSKESMFTADISRLEKLCRRPVIEIDRVIDEMVEACELSELR